MPQALINFYNLQKGVDLDEYISWSKRVDQPTCNSLDVCDKFQVYLVGKTEGSGESYDVAEYIEVESYKAWDEAQKSDAFSQIRNDWPQYAVEDSLVTIYCDEIK